METLQALALWGLVLVGGCGSATVAVSALGEPAVLRVGESVEVSGEDLRIGFVAVRQDSRCPVDVVCVWEGVATVDAWAKKGSEERHDLVLATSNKAGHSTRADYLGYEVELLELAPAKSGSVQQADYRVTLVVRAK